MPGNNRPIILMGGPHDGERIEVAPGETTVHRKTWSDRWVLYARSGNGSFRYVGYADAREATKPAK